MIVYWLLFLIPAAGLFSPRDASAGLRSSAWVLCAACFSVVIGFRHEVGGDWFAYQDYVLEVRAMDFRQALVSYDPGYAALNWLVTSLGGDIYWVNLLCAILVMSGVTAFARQQPAPPIALLVAVPYLIIVVAMGYSRQGAALGLALLGLTALSRQHVRMFVFWTLAATLFHKSAALLLPIAGLAASRHKFWTTLWVAAVSLLAALLFVLEHSSALWENYVTAQYQSEGGSVRVAMNAVAAALLLLFHRRLEVRDEEWRLWFWMALLSLACIPLVFLASTAVDRLALYFIPLQIYVFSRLHRLAQARDARAAITLAVVAYYALVLHVWLNYSPYAEYWVPYQFMPA